MIEWKTWDSKVIADVHGDVYAYRKLYDGKHIELFPRAQRLLLEQEAYDSNAFDEKLSPNVKTPYIQANISRLICQTPAMFVSRSIGEIKASVQATAEQNETTGAADGAIEGPNGDAVNDKIVNLQQEMIDQITKNSRLKYKHFQNVVQHQIDGGIVGVPFNDDRGYRIDFKKRDVYFPHEDDMGVDLAYYVKREEEEFLHVYRERVEVERVDKKRDYTLETFNFVFKLNGTNLEQLPDDEAAEFLGMSSTTDLYNKFPGRSTPFVVYWPNEPTFEAPNGESTLKDQFGKQDEINWTLTKGSAVFTKNGEPRLVVSAGVFAAAQQAAEERYGKGAPIDHRDLNIITYDENGKAMELVQLDVANIGNMQWVKDLMKEMLMETRTSEKAIDFYMEGGNSAQSGEAKWYDLLISMIKCEQIQDEYIHFLQELYENVLWLANHDDSNIVIAEPIIETREMIPVSRKELVDETLTSYKDGGASLETVVRRLNPTASEDFIQEEIKRLQSEEESAFPIE